MICYTYTKLDVLECSDGAWTKVVLEAVCWLLTSNWEEGSRLPGVVKVVEGVLKRTPLLLVVVFLLLPDFNSWNSFRLRVLYFGVLFCKTLLLVEVWTCWLGLACQLSRAAWWELGNLHSVLELLIVEVWRWLVRAGLRKVSGWSEEAGPFHGLFEPLMYQPLVWVNRVASAIDSMPSQRRGQSKAQALTTHLRWCPRKGDCQED